LARGRKVTRGRKLRVDTTAVETEIHYPTDSGLIGDGVRVISRLLRRAKGVLGEAASQLTGAFRSRVRTVRKLAQQLHRIARRKGQQGREALQAAYTKLIETAEKTGAQGKRVLEALKRSGAKGAEHLAGRFGEFLPRLTQETLLELGRLLGRLSLLACIGERWHAELPEGPHSAPSLPAVDRPDSRRL
jgi:transposase, IS5 family